MDANLHMLVQVVASKLVAQELAALAACPKLCYSTHLRKPGCSQSAGLQQLLLAWLRPVTHPSRSNNPGVLTGAHCSLQLADRRRKTCTILVKGLHGWRMPVSCSVRCESSCQCRVPMRAKVVPMSCAGACQGTLSSRQCRANVSLWHT